MACEKHKLRKRYDSCPECQAELKAKKEVIKAPKSTIKEAVIVQPSPTIAEPIEQPVDVNKALKDAISDYIKKEVRKQISAIADELITEEARTNARKTAHEAMDKAVDAYKYRIRELSDVQYEHLAVPVSVFRVSLLTKLTGEGWKMVQTFSGEVARVSGYKTDVVIFTRVKNEKWPEAPKYD